MQGRKRKGKLNGGGEKPNPWISLTISKQILNHIEERSGKRKQEESGGGSVCVDRRVGRRQSDNS